MMPISSANVADLRDAHLGMLREPPDGQVVRHFIGRVARAGAFATVEEDRQVLQKILVHWTARAIRDGNMMLGDAPKLEPFRPDAPPETAEQSSESAAMAIALPTPEEIEKARRRVRISATAEEWKKLGGDGSPVAQGYLLSGEALERARAFIADSATIAELVGASDRDLAETQQALAKSKIVTLRRWLAVVVVVGALVVGLIYQAMTKATATASAKDAEAREARDRAGILLAENEDLKGQINAANRRLQELSSEIDSSKTDTGFTGDVLSQLRDVLPPPPSSGPDTTFLGAPVPLPSPASKGAEFLVSDFAGFSILQGDNTRSPDVAYVWTDRASRAILDQVNPANIIRSLQPPLGLAPERTPGQMEFLRPNLAPMFLVNAADVAWGKAFPFVSGTDAKTRHDQAFAASARIAVLQNVVLVPPDVSRESWSAVNEYALTGFAPGEGRITAISGPLKDSDDRVVGLWKVLVAADSSVLTQLQVEAFLVESGRPINPDATQFLIRLDDLEKWTGLDFGAALRASDTASSRAPSRLPPSFDGSPLPASTQQLAARVPALDAPDVEQRKAAFTAISAAFASDVTLAQAVDRGVVLDALLAQLTPEAYSALSPDGRFNLVSLLATLPSGIWSDPGLLRQRAEARRKLEVLSRLGADGKFGSFSKTAGRIADAQAQLGAALAQDRTLYVQFAVFVREDVEAISEALRPLGWTIPAEERTEAATGLNELRFHPDDALAAALFLGDLSLAYGNPVRPRETRIVKPGLMELWISK